MHFLIMLEILLKYINKKYQERRKSHASLLRNGNTISPPIVRDVKIKTKRMNLP